MASFKKSKDIADTFKKVSKAEKKKLLEKSSKKNLKKQPEVQPEPSTKPEPKINNIELVKGDITLEKASRMAIAGANNVFNIHNEDGSVSSYSNTQVNKAYRSACRDVLHNKSGKTIEEIQEEFSKSMWLEERKKFDSFCKDILYSNNDYFCELFFLALDSDLSDMAEQTWVGFS